jgi:hypothetical protein
MGFNLGFKALSDAWLYFSHPKVSSPVLYSLVSVHIYSVVRRWYCNWYDGCAVSWMIRILNPGRTSKRFLFSPECPDCTHPILLPCLQKPASGSVSPATWIHSILFHPNCVRSIVILCFQLWLILPICLPTVMSSDHNALHILCFPSMLHAVLISSFICSSQ